MMQSVQVKQHSHSTSPPDSSPKDDVNLHASGIGSPQITKLQDQITGSLEFLDKHLKDNDYKSKESLTHDEFLTSFRNIFKLDGEKDKLMLERIFDLTDSNHNGIIEQSEYMTLVSLLYANSSDQKLRFIFNAFDLNGDGKISREELTHIVNTLWQNDLCRHLFDFAIDERRIEGVDVFVSSFFKQAGREEEGLLTFEDYQKVSSQFTHVKADHKLKIMENQTGGHADNFKKLSAGKIMKATNLIEFNFYEALHSKYSFMAQWAPTYYGPDHTNNKNCIIIEDLTAGMTHPCIMDIKMGTCSAGDDASPEKRESMIKKDANSTTQVMGVRITGAKVYNNITKESTQYTKSWGRKVTEETFTESLTKYFDNGDRIRYDIVNNLRQKLQPFQDWMSNQSKLRFYSSSLLFVYDADTSERTDKHPAGEVFFCMIDFAHVSPITEPNGHDDGYILGLKNLMKSLDSIYSKA